MPFSTTTRPTAHRSGPVAAAAVLGAALVLAGCSGGTADGVYQESGSAYQHLVIDGDTVLYLDAGAEDVVAMLEAIDSGDVDEDSEYIEEVGTLNDARDTVIWSDGDDDAIEIADDMIRLHDPNAGTDSEVYIPYDDDRAQMERERVIPEKTE